MIAMVGETTLHKRPTANLNQKVLLEIFSVGLFKRNKRIFQKQKGCSYPELQRCLFTG